MWHGFHHDARKRTTAMSVKSDAAGVQSSQASERSSHQMLPPPSHMAARPDYDVPGGLEGSPCPPEAAAFWANDWYHKAR